MGTSRRLLALVTALLLADPLMPQAAEISPLGAGQVVRVSVPGLGSPPLVGRVIAIDEDGLLLRDGEGRTRRIAFGSISRLERRERRGTRIGSGALWGAALLGGYGLVGGLLSSPNGGDLDVCDTRGECALKAAVSLAALGALAGGCLGAFRATEDWRDISPPPTRIALVPRVGNGVGLALAVRW
jgi:hypothetical protein